jgi:hypothetical protein
VNWVYKGSLAPNRLNILIVHTICLGAIYATCQAGSSGDLVAFVAALKSLDDVGVVDTWNYMNYPNVPTAPDLSLMMQYDVIIVATNWAYTSYAPFDLARRQVGDRLADYMDSGRGGVLTEMAVYDLSGGADTFAIRGRYITDQYGPFKGANYNFGGTTLGERLDPNHDVFTGVGPDVQSTIIFSGNYPLTVGGKNNAAGMNGILLAKWSGGQMAVGVKTLLNGARDAHFGAWATPAGADTPMLLRNLIGWVSGGLPSPKIPDFTHVWGDNGIYTVTITAIDDDMGFVWDAAANAPVQVLFGQGTGFLSERKVTVSVDNVDPTIQTGAGGAGFGAFIATKVCLRVSGQAGNTVTANIFADGVLVGTTTVTRQDNGGPNPTTDKCGLFKIDVMGTGTHTYSADLVYQQPNGGSNPTWLIFQPWREPITPGHGTVTLKVDLSAPGTTVVPLPTLKQDLIAGGQGAKIDFQAEASDPGTDDLAFFWIWGAGGAYVPGSPTSDYTIHVWHNDGGAMANGVLAGTQFLGFTEPYFDRTANTGRSPFGTENFDVRDTATHSFSGGQALYYVTLIVLDDDNARGYASHFAPNDGTDMAFFVINLA